MYPVEYIIYSPMKTEHGAFELETSRDYNGSFESEIIKKDQTHISDEIEKMLQISVILYILKGHLLYFSSIVLANTLSLFPVWLNSFDTVFISNNITYYTNIIH